MLKVEIETDFDATSTNEGLAQTLRTLATRIERDGAEAVARVMDTNGNTVGRVTFAPERRVAR